MCELCPTTLVEVGEALSRGPPLGGRIRPRVLADASGGWGWSKRDGPPEARPGASGREETWSPEDHEEVFTPKEVFTSLHGDLVRTLVSVEEPSSQRGSVPITSLVG